ncbi:MAG TPA: DUF1643 domain-containing protein [bacterium]|nr:DUF1643 domain-containing protein [bacterium]
MIENAKIVVRAEMSDDRKLRFLLERIWDKKKPAALFILLNPSKASVYKLDNTFCNIVNICVDSGYGSLKLVNLFPFMATDPAELKDSLDLGKEENEKVIIREIDSVNDIFIAWGTEDNFKDRKEWLDKLLQKHANNKKIYCWADKDGNYPKHLRILDKDWEKREYKFKYKGGGYIEFSKTRKKAN